MTNIVYNYIHNNSSTKFIMTDIRVHIIEKKLHIQSYT